MRWRAAALAAVLAGCQTGGARPPEAERPPLRLPADAAPGRADVQAVLAGQGLYLRRDGKVAPLPGAIRARPAAAPRARDDRRIVHERLPERRRDDAPVRLSWPGGG